MISLEKLESYRTKLISLVERKKLLEQRKEALTKKKSELAKRYEASLKARSWINEVSIYTMNQLSLHIGSLVTKALQDVFPDPYTFKLEFVQKRNQTECELYLYRGGFKTHPMDSVGGGVTDVVNFALRTTYWRLKGDLNPIFILDEPFKFVSHQYQSYCSNMLQEFCRKLGIQIIMVSHIQNIIDKADRVFVVTQESVPTCSHPVSKVWWQDNESN